MSAEKQRNQALSNLDKRIKTISKLYRECYLSSGKGALLLYAADINNNSHIPNKEDYRKKDQILEIFDSPSSKSQLRSMINKYDAANEGILTLITSYSNATYFITVKLK